MLCPQRPLRLLLLPRKLIPVLHQPMLTPLLLLQLPPGLPLQLALVVPLPAPPQLVLVLLQRVLKQETPPLLDLMSLELLIADLGLVALVLLLPLVLQLLLVLLGVQRAQLVLCHPSLQQVLKEALLQKTAIAKMGLLRGQLAVPRQTMTLKLALPEVTLTPLKPTRILLRVKLTPLRMELELERLLLGLLAPELLLRELLVLRRRRRDPWAQCHLLELQEQQMPPGQPNLLLKGTVSLLAVLPFSASVIWGRICL